MNRSLETTPPVATPKNQEYPEPTPAESLLTKNEIQCALMKDFGVEAHDKKAAIAWITTYAADFSDYLYVHPALAHTWRNGTQEEQNEVLAVLILAEQEGFPRQETYQ